MFQIQDEIAQSIARALRGVIAQGQDHRERADVGRPGVRLLPQGSRVLPSMAPQESPLCARDVQQGDRDRPPSALAYAGVADCCSSLYTWFEADEANREETERASRKALELNPDLAEAHCARGLALTIGQRYDEARAELEAARGHAAPRRHGTPPVDAERRRPELAARTPADPGVAEGMILEPRPRIRPRSGGDREQSRDDPGRAGVRLGCEGD